MPTAAQVDRLQALIQRLTPLSNVQRGELIRAQDWNVLVGTLIEVSRAAIVDEDDDKVPPHEHPDQVSTAWLDTTLRSLVEQVTLSDPTGEVRVTRLTQQVERLNKRMDDLSTAFAQLRARLDDFWTRDLTRESQLTTIRQRFEGLSDPREEVLALRRSLGALQVDVRKALELGTKVSVDGQGIDLRKLADRVKNVEDFRDSMRVPASGALLDAKTLDLRLAEMSNKFVSHARLEEAFKNRPVTVKPENLEEITTKLTATVNTTVQSSLGRVREEIHAETGKRLSGLDALVARSVNDAGVSLRSEVLNAVQGHVAAVTRKTAEDTNALIEKRLNDTTASLRGAVTQEIGALRLNIEPTVRAAVEEHSTRLISPLHENVKQIIGRVGVAESKLNAQEENVRATATRVEATARNLLAANTETRAQLLAEMGRRDEEQNKRLSLQLAQADLVTKPVLDRAVLDARSAALEEARKTAAESARAEVRGVEVRLVGESRRIAKEELQSSTEHIRGLVTSEVKSHLDVMPSIVNAEVRRATAQLPDLVRTEFNTLSASSTRTATTGTNVFRASERGFVVNK